MVAGRIRLKNVLFRKMVCVMAVIYVCNNVIFYGLLPNIFFSQTVEL